MRLKQNDKRKQKTERKETVGQTTHYKYRMSSVMVLTYKLKVTVTGKHDITFIQ